MFGLHLHDACCPHLRAFYATRALKYASKAPLDCRYPLSHGRFSRTLAVIDYEGGNGQKILAEGEQ
jgi:hypothetical protein